jgi:hypothetical protein
MPSGEGIHAINRANHNIHDRGQYAFLCCDLTGKFQPPHCVDQKGSVDGTLGHVR